MVHFKTQEVKKMECYFCGNTAYNTMHGYIMCEECQKNALGMLIVFCANEECGLGFGMVRDTDENINKICFINSLDKNSQPNELSYNMFLTVARNTNQKIFPVRYCPYCSEA
jgi:hypothetical protein